MNSKLPTLPQSLLNLICEYGMARTDKVSPLEIQHRWELLIAGIKDYAASVSAKLPWDERIFALYKDALEVFDGPETPQAVRDVIEWYHGSLLATQPPQDERGQGLTTMQSVPWRSVSGAGEYSMAFYFPDLATLQKAEDEWRALATSSAEPARPVALSTLTDDDIEQFIYERCKRFMTADMIPAIRALAASAPAQQDKTLMEDDAVDTLIEEGWIWDGDQWQRPPEKVNAIPAEKFAPITAAMMRDDSGDSPTYCLMVAFRTEREATAALSIVSGESTPPHPVALSDAEIAEIAERMEASDPTASFWREFAREILALAAKGEQS